MANILLLTHDGSFTDRIMIDELEMMLAQVILTPPTCNISSHDCRSRHFKLFPLTKLIVQMLNAELLVE
jgi:hypothetical protein